MSTARKEREIRERESFPRQARMEGLTRFFVVRSDPKSGHFRLDLGFVVEAVGHRHARTRNEED